MAIIPGVVSSVSTSTALLSAGTTAATSLANLILVTPNLTVGYQPLNAPDANGNPSKLPLPPSFMFHYEGEQTATLTSDITDHYVEDNTAIQDNIALQPVIVSTQGYIGELNNVLPAVLAPLKAVVDNLTLIDAYSPSLSQTALLAYNQAFQLYQVGQNAINTAVSAWASISGGGGASVVTGVGTGSNTITLQNAQNKQQTAFQFFYGCWVNRILFNIQTPWAVFANMAIQTLRPIQNEETRMITSFECSFKQIRTVQYALTPPTSAVSQGRLSSQSSGLTNQGVSTPPESISLGTGLSNNYPGVFA